jgi:catechol 2,3-dioxygenase
VADLERALGFYCGVLGFELTQRYGRGGVHFRGRVSSSYWSQHVGKSRCAAPPGATGLYHPRSPPDAGWRPRMRCSGWIRAGILRMASDHGVSG